MTNIITGATYDREKHKTHWPVYRKSSLVNDFFSPTLFKVEILNKCWLLEISSSTETYIEGTKKSKAKKSNKNRSTLRKTYIGQHTLNSIHILIVYNSGKKMTRFFTN